MDRFSPHYLPAAERFRRGLNAILDLEQIKLVDRDFNLVLAQSKALGAELRKCSVFIRKWIDKGKHALQSGAAAPRPQPDQKDKGE